MDEFQRRTFSDASVQPSHPWLGVRKAALVHRTSGPISLRKQLGPHHPRQPPGTVLLPLQTDQRAGPEIHRRMLFVSPATVREEVEYRLETMQRRRLSEVEEAQVKIVQIATQMADEGILVFGGTEPLV